LTVHGATFLTPPVGTASYTARYANNATVTIGSATVVSEDGVAASGLTPAAISVGQQLDVSGQGSVDSSGNVSLDATACSSAPPDFTATAITAGTATEQRLVVEWINGAAATAPFISASSAGLVVDLKNAALGTIHEIRTGPPGPANTGPGVRDLTLLPTSPPFTIVGAAQADLRLAIGSAS